MVEDWSEDKDLENLTNQLLCTLRNPEVQPFHKISSSPSLDERWKMIDKKGYSALYYLILRTSHPSITDDRPRGTLTNKDYLTFLSDIIGRGAIVSPWSKVSQRSYDPWAARTSNTITRFEGHLPREILKIVEDYYVGMWDGILYPHHPESPYCYHKGFAKEVYSCLSFVVAMMSNPSSMEAD